MVCVDSNAILLMVMLVYKLYQFVALLMEQVFRLFCFMFNPFTTQGPAAGPYVNTVSSSDTWLIIITRNLPISIEVIQGDS